VGTESVCRITIAAGLIAIVIVGMNAAAGLIILGRMIVTAAATAESTYLRGNASVASLWDDIGSGNT
jgi:hypothetical protein